MKNARKIRGRPTCVECKVHPRGYLIRGRFKRDKDHSLCQRCYQAQLDSNRAGRLHVPLVYQMKEDFENARA